MSSFFEEARKTAESARSARTQVGCVLYWSNGATSKGHNIEGPFATSVHAEVAAIANLDGWTGAKIREVYLVSSRRKFTPCGACRDWLYWYAESPDVLVKVEGVGEYRLGDLIPEFPE